MLTVHINPWGPGRSDGCLRKRSHWDSFSAALLAALRSRVDWSGLSEAPELYVYRDQRALLSLNTGISGAEILGIFIGRFQIKAF